MRWGGGAHSVQEFYTIRSVETLCVVYDFTTYLRGHSSPGVHWKPILRDKEESELQRRGPKVLPSPPSFYAGSEYNRFSFSAPTVLQGWTA